MNIRSRNIEAIDFNKLTIEICQEILNLKNTYSTVTSFFDKTTKTVTSTFRKFIQKFVHLMIKPYELAYYPEQDSRTITCLKSDACFMLRSPYTKRWFSKNKDNVLKIWRINIFIGIYVLLRSGQKRTSANNRVMALYLSVFNKSA